MKIRNHENRSLLQIAIALALATVLAGCGKKDEAPAASTAAAPPAEAAPAAAASADTQAPVIPPAAAVPTSWTVEAMEELLAPIALYPDPVLMQVLTAAGNPQEVLDAGNWLLQNQSLTGSALDQAASKVGFTPPTRAILQFPATLDMMCQEMAWTTELGQAFVADQQGVLDAVQRLRFQAQDVGNLKSSPQMNVSMQDQGGQQVIYLKPADPEVVYVPQYDPVAVYAPAPAATTTTTTVVQEGHSTGALITTGLLAFGAGMLVNEIFDDDDDWNDRYYPRYGYGGGYNYYNYPYRPAYGNGYYPNNGYNRPPNYNNGWQNNGNINTGDITINTGGNRPNAGGNRPDFNDSRLRTGTSPISKANPNRDMSKVNQRAAAGDGKRPGATAGSSDWKGQSGYAGANKSPTGKPSADMANKARDQAKSSPITQQGQRDGKQPKQQGGYAGAQQGQRDGKQPKQQGGYAGAQQGQRDGKQPKQQGGYAGANSSMRDAQRPSSKPAARDVQRPDSKPYTRDVQRPDSKPYTRDVQRPQQAQQRSKDTADRGYGGNSGGGANRQQTSRQQYSGGGHGGGSMSGASHGGSDRAASQRGKQSSGGSGQQRSRR